MKTQLVYTADVYTQQPLSTVAVYRQLSSVYRQVCHIFPDFRFASLSLWISPGVRFLIMCINSSKSICSEDTTGGNSKMSNTTATSEAADGKFSVLAAPHHGAVLLVQ